LFINQHIFVNIKFYILNYNILNIVFAFDAERIKMKHLTGIGEGCGLGLPWSITLPMIAGAGFDAFFTGWNRNLDVEAVSKLAKSCGLIYQSIHAPFTKMYKMWEDEGPEGEAVADELIDCMHDAAKVGVGIIVIHPNIGMDRHNPTSLGVSRYARVLEEGEKCGVKCAIENVEGIEYLIRLRDELSSSPALGFCWDTGHEMCYNGSMDVPALFNGKLICTHLNDNLKQSDPNVITWLDDSHLVPFDGLADWEGIAARLDRENYTDIMMYELTTKSKPGKNTHDIYAGLKPAEFYRLAYERAVKLDSLRKI